MPDPVDKLAPADPADLAAALAFALRFEGRRRVHNADEIMAEIVAKRLVEHVERAGFVVMKRSPIVAARRLGEDPRPDRLLTGYGKTDRPALRMMRAIIRTARGSWPDTRLIAEIKKQRRDTGRSSTHAEKAMPASIAPLIACAWR
jgi:hypothetical protein